MLILPVMLIFRNGDRLASERIVDILANAI